MKNILPTTSSKSEDVNLVAYLLSLVIMQTMTTCIVLQVQIMKGAPPPLFEDDDNDEDLDWLK